MKKLCIALALMLLCAVGAQAASGSVYLNISQPDKVTVMRDSEPLEASPAMTIPFNTAEFTFITIKVKDSEDDCYVVSCTGSKGSEGFFENRHRTCYIYPDANGEVFTVTVGDAAAYRPNAFTFNIDRAEGMHLSFGGAVDDLPLVDGANTIRFAADETTLNFFKADAPWYQLRRNGSVVSQAEDNYYISNLHNGDVFDVVCAFPDDATATLTINCSDWNAFKALAVDGVDLLPEANGTKLVKTVSIPYTLTYKLNIEDYKIGRTERVGTQREESESDVSYPDYENTFANNFILSLSLTRYAKRNYTVTAHGAEGIWLAADLEWADPIALTEGDNDLTLSTKVDGVAISALPGYAIEEVKRRGVVLDREAYTMYHTVPVSSGDVIEVTAAPDHDVAFSLNIDAPEAVSICPTDYPDDYYTLAPGQNTLTLLASAKYDGICVTPHTVGARYDIVSLTDGEGHAYQSTPKGWLVRPVREGMTVNVVTTPVERPARAEVMIYTETEDAWLPYVYIDLPEHDYEMLPTAGQWQLGYNDIVFAGDESLMRLNMGVEDGHTHSLYIRMYRNGELIDSEGDSFFAAATVADGDVYKVYADYEPQTLHVDFTENTPGLVSVATDIIHAEPAYADGLDVLTATRLDIAPVSPSVEVRLGGDILAPDADGIYRLTITEPCSIALSGDLSAISSPEAPAADTTVFNLQGIRIASSPHGLPPGVYICAGRKIVIR